MCKVPTTHLACLFLFMSSMSKTCYDRSSAYVGYSKFPCFCGEAADLWQSGTTENPGRLFVKCGCEKVIDNTSLVELRILLYSFRLEPTH